MCNYLYFTVCRHPGSEKKSTVSKDKIINDRKSIGMIILHVFSFHFAFALSIQLNIRNNDTSGHWTFGRLVLPNIEWSPNVIVSGSPEGNWTRELLTGNYIYIYIYIYIFEMICFKANYWNKRLITYIFFCWNFVFSNEGWLLIRTCIQCTHCAVAFCYHAGKVLIFHSNNFLFNLRVMEVMVFNATFNNISVI